MTRWAVAATSGPLSYRRIQTWARQASRLGLGGRTPGSPAAPHPADRAKSGASHFLALIFLLVIPATDVEGHALDPDVEACANAEAAALALALRTALAVPPEINNFAEVTIARWEALSVRCKSLTEPDPAPDVEGYDADPEYEASLMRGQRKACRKGKRKAFHAATGAVDRGSGGGRRGWNQEPTVFKHTVLEDVYLMMMRLCAPLNLPIPDVDADPEEYEAARIRGQRKACRKELANWPDAQVFDSNTAAYLEDVYPLVVNLCAPLGPFGPPTMDDES